MGHLQDKDVGSESYYVVEHQQLFEGRKMKKAQMSVFLVAALGIVVALCGRMWASDCMVAYWRFDEGEGTILQDSANGNDGTICGASWTDGIVGTGLDFDGIDDYVNAGNSPDLTSLTPAGMTIEAWVCNTRTIDEGAVDIRTVIAQRGLGLRPRPQPKSSSTRRSAITYCTSRC